ncbi:MAG: hypothetical protein Fues2KO_52060 [Fuerstiella sp.]
MKLLEALKTATVNDLLDLERRIDELSRETEMLKEVWSILKHRFPDPVVPEIAERDVPELPDEVVPELNETAEDPAERFGKPGAKITQRRQKIFEYLIANGPQTQMQLVNELGIPTGSITATLDHPYFRKKDGVVDVIG